MTKSTDDCVWSEEPTGVLIISTSEYECPTHGNVKEDIVKFSLSDGSAGVFCTHCLFDICRKHLKTVTKIEKKPKSTHKVAAGLGGEIREGR